MLQDTKLFSGNANPQLAADIAHKLHISLGKADVKTFSDGEIATEINESVRGETIFLIQPTCAPANDNLMELLIITDALKRSATKQIYAVIPYFGYARQDRRPGFSRVPITSRLIADMIQSVGIDQIITVDLHSTQQQGFFSIPSINVSAAPIFIADIWRKYMHDPSKVLIVSPDVGGVARARSIAKQLDNAELAIVDKRRPNANESEVMNIIGDVEGMHCILIDDMVDTAGTLCKAATALKKNGALSVTAYCTHPVLSGAAHDNIGNSVLDELVVTDTIPLRESAPSNIRVLSVASLLAETIHRIKQNLSVSAIYAE